MKGARWQSSAAALGPFPHLGALDRREPQLASIARAGQLETGTKGN